MTNSFIKILKKLKAADHEAYIVGGCVRDMLLGKEPKDIDIATSATPDEIEALFKNTIPTGKKYGTITVIIDGEKYEVTTFRTDGKYSNSRKPDNIIFGTNIIDDLGRRDFTINAMAMDINGNIIDPFNGQEDIELKTIKCVGNPDSRFTEDALRMMRAVRFASTHNFRLNPGTYNSIRKNAQKVRNISWERIREEFSKTITSPNPGYGMNLLTNTNLVKYILPELIPCIGFNQQSPYHDLDVYNHTITVINATPPKLHLRLTALFHDIAKPYCITFDEIGNAHYYGHEKKSAEMAYKIMKRFKYPNSEIGKVITLVINHMERTSGIKPGKLLQNVGADLIFDLFELERADIVGTAGNIAQEMYKIAEKERAVQELIDKNMALTIKDLAVNGYDLMTVGIKPGKTMGNILHTLLEIVIEHPEKNKKTLLLHIAKNA